MRKLIPFMDLQLFAGETGEVADPQTEEFSEEVAEETDQTTGESDTAEGGAELADQPERTSPQDPKIDAAFAKMRREKEELEKQLKARDKWVEETFGKTHGLHTWEDYQRAIEEERQRQQEAEWREKGIDPNLIREILKNDPEYKGLQEKLSAYEQQIKAQEAQKKFESEFNELKSEYPDQFKSIEDLNRLQPEVISKMEEKLKKGYSLLDAFESANRAFIKKKTAEKVKQQTLNNIQGKSHLKTEGDGAKEGNDIHIPQDTLQMYLDMGLTKDQAYKHYKKIYG